ncbi:MAG: orotidine-5'-phosphate decarboxylase [Gammaproteobacteria bacterium]
MSVDNPRIIVALDFPSAAAALALARQLDPARCRLKVGKELFTAAGPQLVEELQALGFNVFLDLKFHDIPATVAGACRAAASLGVWMLNVHASGGRRMLEAAAKAVAGSLQPPLLTAVTVLTSLSEIEAAELGFQEGIAERVKSLALLSADCGLDGAVCSAAEATLLRQHLPQAFKLVTPGIRPAGSASDDQSRITTPALALQNGADYLVIGRPITQATDPLAALAAIETEIHQADQTGSAEPPV